MLFVEVVAEERCYPPLTDTEDIEKGIHRKRKVISGEIELLYISAGFVYASVQSLGTFGTDVAWTTAVICYVI